MSICILHIDTCSTVCSASISIDGKLLDERIELESNKHTALLNVFIEDLLSTNSLKIKDIDAVSVTNGPGSYTGLRVGMSTAKGICYGIDRPLIILSALEVLATEFINKGKQVISCMDARRKEIYMAQFDEDGKRVLDDLSFVLEDEQYPESWPNPSELIICGNAAEKTNNILNISNLECVQTYSKSSQQCLLALESFKKGKFADVSLIRPNYLKPPKITKSKKSLF